MKYIALFLTGLLAGCAAPTIVSPPLVELRSGRVPTIGEVSKATVGSPMFSQFHYWHKAGYRLGGEVNTRIMLGRVQAGVSDFVAPSMIDGQKAYCSEALTYVDPMTGPFKTACFIDADEDGFFESVKAAPGAIWLTSNLVPKVPYSKVEQIIPRADGKKSEILYQGYSSKTLRVAYREYVNDLARPSYFQDVTYEVSAFPTELSFKNLRIEVLDAGNTGITYRVISPFEL